MHLTVLSVIAVVLVTLAQRSTSVPAPFTSTEDSYRAALMSAWERGHLTAEMEHYFPDKPQGPPQEEVVIQDEVQTQDDAPPPSSAENYQHPGETDSRGEIRPFSDGNTCTVPFAPSV